MKKIGILYHPMKEGAQHFAQEIQQLLNSRDMTSWLCSAWDTSKALTLVNDTDLMLTIGGDGTILRAAQVALSARAPITGINLGKLGFMTELSADEAIAKLPALLDGQGWLDERAMLEAEIETEATKASHPYFALNDVVVARGAIPRTVNIEATIDGEPLTNYRGDGVIVATATGSTSYSLAAGGPILHPQSADFLLVPIVPHLSLSYTLVLPASATVRLRISTVHQAVFSIDGHINMPVDNGTTITVRRGAKWVRFLRLQPKNTFYSHLEQKLKGKHQFER